ncbi:MAG: SRPBCC family protein [Bacteroidetes bacterium]|nr:MAG: SRPBCC family protein [Bacteroidota bacterium]
MTEINSEHVDIQKPAKEIFIFLSDFNNFEKLMPEQVVNWKSTNDTCSFTIKGMATLGMRHQSMVEHSEINLVSDGSAPFSFTLSCLLDDKGNNTDAQMKLNADLNPMLKMMAKKPLQNFVNLLVKKLKEVMEG